MRQLIIGVFPDPDAAKRAHQRLAAASLGEITTGMARTDDAIAAEAPGQAYVDLTRHQGDCEREAQLVDAVNSGARTLTIVVNSTAAAERAVQLMRESGSSHIKTA